MNIWELGLRIAHWSFEIKAPVTDKCVICVAPHTSNWDFLLGLAAYRSVGRKANFLMKSFWFFFPLKYLLRSLGGIPVVRTKGKNSPSLTDRVISLFKTESYVNLAVTPEGTRSATEKWKTGFLYIAYGAGVPIMLGVIDYSQRRIVIDRMYNPTGDVETDMRAIREYYSQWTSAAKYPEKFIP